MKSCVCRSPEMRDLLLPYLGTRTEHFQHEFYNFARSPYDLVGFDRNAAYEARCEQELSPTFILDGNPYTATVLPFCAQRERF